ncbi:hypothetical protein CQW23_03846 [Capsicum baccatum]|uniref:Uncharacterized protein n=1 Tax=Capsicum baccatum TaxID=33114 RepID=A0A2G2XD05_CAPBA|nr:hypothetical protein CQW23_03846 [Capsicum baccatum]
MDMNDLKVYNRWFMKLRLDRVLQESYEADSLEEALASTPVIEATPNGEPSDPNDSQLDLSNEMPRFYIMQIKCFQQNLSPSFDKSLTCSFCDKALSPPFFPTRSLRFSSITHHANVTQFLGSIAGDVWYLGVAKPSIVEMHGQSMSIYLPPVVDEVQAFRVSDPKFIKLNVDPSRFRLTHETSFVSARALWAIDPSKEHKFGCLIMLFQQVRRMDKNTELDPTYKIHALEAKTQQMRHFQAQKNLYTHLTPSYGSFRSSSPLLLPKHSCKKQILYNIPLLKCKAVTDANVKRKGEF